MKLITYTPDRFDLVREAALKIKGNYSLHHRPFVDYYYATRADCSLYLALSAERGVVGLVGVERMPFQSGSGPVVLGSASNFHAFQHGVGGLLFLQWMRFSAMGLEYGGSEDAHRLIRSQKWRYFPGVRLYSLNHDYSVNPCNPTHVRGAKWFLRKVARKKISSYASRVPEGVRNRLSVREEFDYSADLLPAKSPFSFRLNPTVEYLSWRYNTRLSFINYRLFRILEQGRTSGYVIISEGAQRLQVAQCDGVKAEALAYGVLLAILKVAAPDKLPRSVLLVCSNPVMGKIYEAFGLKRSRDDYPFAIGPMQGEAEIPADTSNWLVNYDWGDLGLLGPFRDQEAIRANA